MIDLNAIAWYSFTFLKTYVDGSNPSILLPFKYFQSLWDKDIDPIPFCLWLWHVDQIHINPQTVDRLWWTLYSILATLLSPALVTVHSGPTDRSSSGPDTQSHSGHRPVKAWHLQWRKGDNNIINIMSREARGEGGQIWPFNSWPLESKRIVVD